MPEEVSREIRIRIIDFIMSANMLIIAYDAQPRSDQKGKPTILRP